MRLKERGEQYDAVAYAGMVRDAVAEVVDRQVAAGVDVICDGEQGKPSFLTYVKDAFQGLSPGRLLLERTRGRDRGRP